MFEVYVRYDPVLRLPPPVDRGRPTWIDAGTARTPGSASTPAPRPEPVAVPPPEPSPPATSSVRQGLGRWLTTQPHTPTVPAAAQQWLAERAAQLAGNPRIRQAARVNSEDNFGLVFTPAMEDDLVEALTAEAENPAASLYFGDQDFAAAFDAYARHAVYQAIQEEPHQPAPAPPADSPTAGSSTATPPTVAGPAVGAPAATPPAPRTAAQLARLDVAPGVAYRPAIPVNRPDHHGPVPTPTARPRSGP